MPLVPWMKHAILISQIPDLLPTESFQHSFLPIWTPFALLLFPYSSELEGRRRRNVGREGVVEQKAMSKSITLGPSTAEESEHLIMLTGTPVTNYTSHEAQQVAQGTLRSQLLDPCWLPNLYVCLYAEYMPQ